MWGDAAERGGSGWGGYLSCLDLSVVAAVQLHEAIDFLPFVLHKLCCQPVAVFSWGQALEKRELGVLGL